jgi:hypothetical protein
LETKAKVSETFLTSVILWLPHEIFCDVGDRSSLKRLILGRNWCYWSPQILSDVKNRCSRPCA